MTLASLGFELVSLIGISDRFTELAVTWLAQGLRANDRTSLEQDGCAGLGEALALAYYKAHVLLPHQPALRESVTRLLLQYRFLCALGGVDDQRGQTFWLRHGLDRELQESTSLHSTSHLAVSQQLEWLCFGRHLAAYFGLGSPHTAVQDPSAGPRFTGLEPVARHLWRFRQAGNPSWMGVQAYLVAPQTSIGVVGVERLCELVAQVWSTLLPLQPEPDAALCAPLGTRKVSISKQGLHSCSTAFDGCKPVPFSLNRGLDAYLVLTAAPLAAAADVQTLRLSFAPLLDSLSTLVFRDPADYRLGEAAFLHQPLVLPVRQPLFHSARGSAARLPTAADQSLVEGLLMQAVSASLSLTPCHDLADRYARSQGLSGHGPSGVMNQSVLLTDQGVLSTWRYERNFDSWSGRSADVARHPSLNFLAWERPGLEGSGPGGGLQITALTYSGFPSECKVEDLRLFAWRGEIYAIGALILSRSRYRSWLPELSAEAAANNTIDDMLVVQAIGRLDPARGDLAFVQLPLLHGAAAAAQAIAPQLPAGFEKNWLIHQHGDSVVLLYSIEPWMVFEGDPTLQHWQLRGFHPFELPPPLQGPLRNSAHPFVLDHPSGQGQGRLGLVVHRRRPNSYHYDQYLMVLSAQDLKPLAISSRPILSVNPQALIGDQGFRKNPGVCYVSCVLVRRDRVFFLFNLFDCRTCVVEVCLSDLIKMVGDPSAFVSLPP